MTEKAILPPSNDHKPSNRGIIPEAKAFLLDPLPVNPIPFARAIAEYCSKFGSDWVKTDEAKAILHLLLQMAYGQLYQVDSFEEHCRLAAIFRE